jgi:hypothetical protein
MSQGCYEALEDILEDPEVVAGFLFAGPFAGSRWATFNSPLPGVRGMACGSRYQDGLRARTATTVAARADVPDLFLFAAHHDGLVSCESAFAISPAYPADRVHRFCLSHGRPNHASEVQWIDVPRGFDTHLTMMRAKPMIEVVRELVQGYGLGLAAA